MKDKKVLAVAAMSFAAALCCRAADDAAAILRTVNDRLAREFISHDGLLLDYVGDIPTAEEIADLKPNAMGWWCPIENGSMFTGEWLPALMSEGVGRKELVERCVRGLVKMSEVSDVPGFIARGTGTDGRSHHPCGSNDQNDPWFLGLSEYCRWAHADPSLKEKALERLVFVARALEANGWGVPCDGPFKGQKRGTLNGKGLPFWCIPRFLYMLKSLAVLTGDAHWRDLYAKAKADRLGEVEAGGEIDAKRIKTCYGASVWIYLSSVQALARLIEMEENPQDRARMRKGLSHYAGRVAPLMKNRVEYANTTERPFKYANWRTGYAWRVQKTQGDAEAVAGSGNREILGERKDYERNGMSNPLCAAAVCALSGEAKYRDEILATLRHYDYSTPNISEFFHAAIAAAAMLPLAANAAEPDAAAFVTVDFTNAVRIVKPMHAVNNGPTVKKPGGDQKCGNFEDYKAARIPFARTHDSISCVSGGAHTCDISAIFPDFDADETDPRNYDFVFTDHYLDNIRRAGTEVFFRLGQTIEHGPKKYGVLPPKDYAKWARICEHVIRHYNEGWGWGLDSAHTTVNIAWSNQFNIVYWEIWNEPDLDAVDIGLPKNPRCWGGTVTNFFQLYETAAKHLKGTFPNLKIGGPAACGGADWCERFLAYCRDNAVPLDFFSWHTYTREPQWIVEKAVDERELMDKYGFQKSESILNEWNYVKGWVDEWPYSLEVESGCFNQKGAAFIMATMVDCQSSPVDMLMFYDARISSGMNNMFSKPTQQPMKGYYPFYAWSKLVDCGTQVACTVREGRLKASDANTGIVFKSECGKPAGSFRAVAAKGADGAGALIVVRYSDDNNVTDTVKVKVSVPGVSLARARCHLTDSVRTYTEVPLDLRDDSTAVIRMQPNSFAVVEWQ